MRTRSHLAIAVTGLSLAGALAAPAVAAPHHAAAPRHGAVTTKPFPITLTPHKNVKLGTIIKAVGTKAKHSTNYSCVLIIDKGANYAVDYGSLKAVTSSATGKVKCSQKFVRFSGTDLHGKTRHCPLTKADDKAGFKCALAISTADMSSGNRAVFTAKASK